MGVSRLVISLVRNICAAGLWCLRLLLVHFGELVALVSLLVVTHYVLFIGLAWVLHHAELW